MDARAGRVKRWLWKIRSRIDRRRFSAWSARGYRRQLSRVSPWIGLAAVAVIALVAVIWLPSLISPDLADGQAQFEILDRARPTVLAFVVGFIVLVGAYINWRRVSTLEQQVSPAQLGQITERVTRANDQLGAVRPDNMPAPEIRAGGVRSLERIAGESAEDFAPILDILNAYLRSELHIPSEAEDAEAPQHLEQARKTRERMDVAAAIAVIERLWPSKHETVPTPLNLANTYVAGSALPEKILQSASLQGAQLFSARLDGASLQLASLQAATLKRASLSKANLQLVDLQGASLWGANLRAPDLAGTNLQTTDCSTATYDQSTQWPGASRSPRPRFSWRLSRQKMRS